MDTPPLPGQLQSESERLAALADLAILDTPPEEELDNLTKLATVALRTSSAAISLVDEHRQWFKSRVGIPFAETPRDIAFCDYTVASRETFLVRDARRDGRFCANPLVTAEHGIGFYAGAPLFLRNGHCIGSLCVIDEEPRPDFGDDDVAVLENLAHLAAQFIEARRGKRMGEIAAKVVDATSDAVLAADRTGTIVFMNAAVERMFGYSRQEAIGENVTLIMPERFRDSHQGSIDNAASGGPTRLLGTFVELPARHADGHEFPIELSLAPWGNDGKRDGFAAIIRDISDRKALEEDRQNSRAFLDTIVANLPAMLFVKDARTRKYLLVNKKAEEKMGRRAETLIGSSDSELFPGIGAAYEERDGEAVASGKPHVYESEFVREDGERFDIRTTRVLMDGPDRKGQYILGMAEDMTEFRRSEAENYRLARYDTLTGLLNRARLAEILHTRVSERTKFAMLSIDLDRFKAINDQFGHLTGDAVLKEVGDRLNALTDENSFVARVGGDEFVALLFGDRLHSRASIFADRIIECISKPIVARRATAHIGASVGAVLHPDDGRTTEQLRENADLALYRAKSVGRGTACFFDDEMDAALRDRRKLESDLRHAVESKHIRLEYQPVVSTSTGAITSLEALARWTHDSRGPVRPDDFISLAEECGLIDQLGSQLLVQACTDALAWPERIRVAVNLSPLQFMSGTLVDTVRETLTSTGLAPGRLQLEVTERLVIQNTEETFAQLEELRALGIQILIDDFGVGHSSLSYFQRLPFDKVKIDKSFIDEIETSRAAKAIVQAVTGLGHQLSMGIVAEGVETNHQRRMLIELGCTHLQGYLFSKSLDAESVSYFIADMEMDSTNIDKAA